MSVENDPVVWVTGASRGIGAAVARAFAAEGARVALSGRTVDALQRNTREIERSGRTAVSVECDVASEASVRRATDVILQKFGRIDVLVNNAGATYFKPFEQTTAEEFDHIIATNLRGTFLCAKSVLPAMVKRGHGFIINIISVTAITAFENSSAYAAAKAGVLGMSRSLRAEVRKKGVRVIDILPGAVETEMWPLEARKKYHAKMMQPEDVADVVVSLYRQPPRVVTEEIIIRPVEGDL